MADGIVFDLTRAGWESWRAARENALAAELGWLTPVALHWLTADPQELEGLPGLWWTSGGVARVLLAPGEEIEVAGIPQAGTVVLHPGPAPWVRYGRLALEPLSRDGQVLLRVRDPEALRRQRFDGVPVFDFDPDWIVEADYVPFNAPEWLRGGSVVETLGHDLQGIGTLTFAKDGAEHRLTVLKSDTYPFNLLFRDATSGVETVSSVRQLSIHPPPGGGGVRVDFNRAVNQPCSFTDFCTCPLPPPGNVLSVPVRAGEKIPKGVGA